MRSFRKDSTIQRNSIHPCQSQSGHFLIDVIRNAVLLSTLSEAAEELDSRPLQLNFTITCHRYQQISTLLSRFEAATASS